MDEVIGLSESPIPHSFFPQGCQSTFPYALPFRFLTLEVLTFSVTRQSQAQWDRSGLPSKNLKLRIIRGGGIGGSAEGAFLRIPKPWFISKMYRFKFSPERPPRSWR
jgi:hypothetical protein